MLISSETVELIVAIIVGALGKFGYDKGRSLITNGRAGYLTRDNHDRECVLKLKPITDSLNRIEGHVEKLLINPQRKQNETSQ